MITQEGDHWVINGRKHWITGAGNVDCKIMILMGRSERLKLEKRPYMYIYKYAILGYYALNV